MDRVILAQCKGGSAIFYARTFHRKGSAKLRSALTIGNVMLSEQMPEGNYATIVSHNPEGGFVTGGDRIDKPTLKAGQSYHKCKAKRKAWSRVRGVAMNVTCRPSFRRWQPSTISRYEPSGRKVVLIAARRTRRVRGTAQTKDD
ncbi:unnamed protein product [Adineta steineri]|uniref:Large ribosomal subunit protein uL2 C-terminal domain-containing protein n=1 Tax=Adineta steineri TaxID=433720 RepID=A0A815EXB9_9BILA|nr:unnamed protein product [Adineta steineri]CAF3824200.1 unnamed protein product [Adineta steineri]